MFELLSRRERNDGDEKVEGDEDDEVEVKEAVSTMS